MVNFHEARPSRPSARNSARRAAFAATGLLLAPLLAAPAAAQDQSAEIAALRASIADLQARLDRMEQEVTTASDAEAAQRDPTTRESGAEATVDDDNTVRAAEEGGFIFPNTDTRVVIGGYAKADFIYDLDEGLGDLLVQENITVSDTGDERNFRAHARQSRLSLSTFSPTEYGELRTHIEGDFFGSGGNEAFSNSTGFRLRHAYGELGPVLAGQYWTLFMPIESYPGTVDFQGPAGIPFIRQAQLRYTHDLGDGLSIAGSLENSEFNGRTSGGVFGESLGSGVAAGLDKAPDAVVAASYTGDGYFLKAAGVGRLLSSPTGGEDEFGYGANISGNADLWPGGRGLVSLSYGDGIGRYIINGFGQDAFVDGAGNIETITSFGATAGVTQSLTETLAAGLTFGYYGVEEAFSPTDLDRLQSAHASLFWSPVERVTVGGEVIYARRENANGASDDAVRLQTAVQFNF